MKKLFNCSLLQVFEVDRRNSCARRNLIVDGIPNKRVSGRKVKWQRRRKAVGRKSLLNVSLQLMTTSAARLAFNAKFTNPLYKRSARIPK